MDGSAGGGWHVWFAVRLRGCRLPSSRDTGTEQEVWGSLKEALMRHQERAFADGFPVAALRHAPTSPMPKDHGAGCRGAWTPYKRRARM